MTSFSTEGPWTDIISFIGTSNGHSSVVGNQYSISQVVIYIMIHYSGTLGNIREKEKIIGS